MFGVTSLVVPECQQRAKTISSAMVSHYRHSQKEIPFPTAQQDMRGLPNTVQALGDEPMHVYLEVSHTEFDGTHFQINVYKIAACCNAIHTRRSKTH